MRFEFDRCADAMCGLFLCISGTMLAGCGKEASQAPSPAPPALVSSSKPFASFIITEPKKGERIKSDSGSIACKGTIRLLPGASEPEYVIVELIRDGAVLTAKAAVLAPAEAADTYRFEVSFDVKSKGKHSFKANSKIISPKQSKVGGPPPLVWTDTTGPVQFIVESIPAKVKPAEK